MDVINGKERAGVSPGKETFTLSGRDYITHYQIRRGSFLLAIIFLAVFIGFILLTFPHRAAFAATGILIFSSLLAIYPFLGLFAQIWLYFRPFPVYGGPDFLRPIFLVTIITMVFFLLNFVFIKKKRVKFTLECKLAMLLLLFMFLSSFFAVHSTSVSFSHNVIFFKIMVFYFLVVNLVTSEKELNAFVWVIIICCALASLEAIKLYRYYGYARIDNVGGVHREANYLAATLVLALPLVFQKMNSRNVFEKAISIGLVPTFMVAIVLTGSRSGTLGLMVVLGLLVWRFRRKRLSLFILAFLILATVVMAPGHYWTRTKTIVDYGEERAAQSRIDLWKAGLQMFVDHPLTGVGQGNFLWISPRYTSNYYRVWTGEGYVAHNIFIQLLAEGGIQALLVFLAFVAVTFRGLSKARRYLFHSHRGRDLIELSQAVEIGLIGFLISGIFLSSAHLDVFYWFLAMGPVICTLAGQESGRLSGIRGSETLVGAAFAGSVKGI